MSIVVVAVLTVLVSSKSILVKDGPFISIDLPFGFQPEGVTAGQPGSSALYVGALAAKKPGTLVKIDVAKERVVKSFHVDADIIVGLWFNKPRKYLVISASTSVIVLDTITGETVKKCVVEEAGFLNDVVIYKGNIYVTDSFRPVIVVLSIKTNSCDYETIPLPDVDFIPGNFNLNGIAKYKGQLLVAQSAAGKIYQVDPFTYATRMVIDRQPAADGIVVKNNLLYTVKNSFNQVQVVKLGMYKSGKITAIRIGKIRNKAFRFPTTGAFVGDDLCVCNARFDEFPPTLNPSNPPNATFDVVCTNPGF